MIISIHPYVGMVAENHYSKRVSNLSNINRKKEDRGRDIEEKIVSLMLVFCFKVLPSRHVEYCVKDQEREFRAS